MRTYSLELGWPEYVAISYTWGDVEPTLPLAVNGQVMRVRLHCWHALWQLRYHGFTRNLWIDSICINQEDYVEKSAQVSMMGQIYKYATSVAACIGSGHTLRRLSTTPDIDVPEFTSEALDELEHTPYFSRLWIKQEIILGKDITLYCGTERLNWRQLEQVIGIILNRSQGPNTREFKIGEKSHQNLGFQQPRIATLYQHRKSQSSAEPRIKMESLAILQLLSQYGESNCVDPRDKIYALLSLLPKDDIAFQYLAVDYSQSTCSLFRQIHAICCHDPLQITGLYSLPSLVQLASWMNVNSKNPEVSQFLQRRLESQAESQCSELPEQDRFVSLRIRRLVFLSNTSDPKSSSRGNLDNEDFEFGRLSLAMSAAEMITTHANRGVHLLRTEELTGLREQGLKQVWGRGFRADSSFRFLVSSDKLEDNVIAEVYWNAHDTAVLEKSTVSWAVLRQKAGIFSGFGLLCWAVPVERTARIEPGVNYFASYCLTAEPLFWSFAVADAIMYLHRDDALAFLAFAQEGVQALATPATITATYSGAAFTQETMDKIFELKSKIEEWNQVQS
jgi:hypothetical protein